MATTKRTNTLLSPPIKRCPSGHKQTPSWKAHHPCMRCDILARQRRNQEEAAEIAAIGKGPAPKVLSMRIVSEERTVYHSIPPYLVPCKPRGPRRRRRI